MCQLGRAPHPHPLQHPAKTSGWIDSLCASPTVLVLVKMGKNWDKSHPPAMGLPQRADILPPCPSMKLFTWTAARRDTGRNIPHLFLPWPFCCVPVGHSSAECGQGQGEFPQPRRCCAEWEQRLLRAQGCRAPAPMEEPADNTSPAGLCVPAPPARLPVSPEELGHHLQSCSARLTRWGSSQVGLYHLGGLFQLQ